MCVQLIAGGGGPTVLDVPLTVSLTTANGKAGIVLLFHKTRTFCIE